MTSPQASKRNHDREFFVRFAVVVVVLHAVIGLFWLVAEGVGEHPTDARIEHRRIAERTAPFAVVRTSQQLTARLARANAGPAADAVAAEKTASGADVVQRVCAACHAGGVLGAPRAHDRAEWARRLEQSGGMPGLVASAVGGKGQMPPRGGAPLLNDAQIREAIEIMSQ